MASALASSSCFDPIPVQLRSASAFVRPSLALDKLDELYQMEGVAWPELVQLAAHEVEAFLFEGLTTQSGANSGWFRQVLLRCPVAAIAANVHRALVQQRTAPLQRALALVVAARRLQNVTDAGAWSSAVFVELSQHWAALAAFQVGHFAGSLLLQLPGCQAAGHLSWTWSTILSSPANLIDIACGSRMDYMPAVPSTDEGFAELFRSRVEARPWYQSRGYRDRGRKRGVAGIDFALRRNLTGPWGLVLEFGVMRGSSLRKLAKRVPLHWEVHGFDWFWGIPEHWTRGAGPGAFSTSGYLPADLPSTARLHVGVFNQTLPKFIKGLQLSGASHRIPQVQLLHLDCDVYSSHVEVLDMLQALLGPGTVIVFDDFFNFGGYRSHALQAFMEVLAVRPRAFRVLAAPWEVSWDLGDIGDEDFWTVGLQRSLAIELVA